MRRSKKAYENFVCPKCFQRLNKCTCRLFPPYSLVFIDTGIQNSVRVLNEKGYRTMGCCEGHFKGVCDHIYVAFAMDYSFPNLPEGFLYEKSRRTVLHRLKSKTKEDVDCKKNKYLKILEQWCEDLHVVDNKVALC